VAACRKLQARYAPDCAQGVFHDYWISLRGADGTTRPAKAVTSPRIVCDGRYGYVRPCWYRYFLERPIGLPIRDAADLRRTCRGLAGIQRFGCISGATLELSSDPFEQMHACLHLRGLDARACVRGVADQALAGKPGRQLALIRMCRTADCYAWLGRTLAVVTNGRFRCAALGRGRPAGAGGAARLRRALVTFSWRGARSGLTAAPRMRTSKCRCGPVASPVAPMRPTRTPCPIQTPTRTSMRERWAYIVRSPWPCATVTSRP